MWYYVSLFPLSPSVQYICYTGLKFFQFCRGTDNSPMCKLYSNHGCLCNQKTSNKTFRIKIACMPSHTLKHHSVRQVKTSLLTAWEASLLQLDQYSSIPALHQAKKDWQVFHSQGWHTTWSTEPNPIFIPLLILSCTAPPLSYSFSPIHIIFHYHRRHPSSRFAPTILKYSKQHTVGIDIFCSLKQSVPLAVVFFIDQRSISNDISSVIHV